MTVTRTQAQAVLKAVCVRYRSYDGVGSIRLVEGSTQRMEGYNRCPFAVVWEEGPYEWALRAVSGGINEEVAAELVAEFAVTNRRAGKMATEEPIAFPAGVHIEPIESFSLGIYPASAGE